MTIALAPEEKGLMVFLVITEERDDAVGELGTASSQNLAPAASSQSEPRLPR